jgi:hypothetical protein
MHVRSIGVAALAALAACRASTSDADVPAHNPDGITIVRGTIMRAAPGALDIKTKDSVVTLTVAQPFHLYTRAPSALSQVTDSTFVGVTTVKQPDGTEQATEVHIFPSELRGLGEGSYMMDQSPNGTLVVHYAAGHARTVVVPPSTPVTIIQPTTDTLAVGGRAVIVARTGPNGALTATAAIVARP